MPKPKPEFTVAAGAVLSIAALLTAVALISWAHPTWDERVGIVVAAMIAGLVGGTMMLKDLTPDRVSPGRRR